MKKTILPHNLFENTSSHKTEKASKVNPTKEASETSEKAPNRPALPSESEYRTFSDKSYLLRMPAALHSRISDLAWKNRQSLHSWILETLIARAEKDDNQE
jgi:predicted HicB family RNase H-like nuclease